MKKPRVVLDPNSRYTPERVEENNRKVREQANPLVRGMMDEVQAAIDQENAQMDAQFEGDAKLRAWAKDLLGYQISMTQIEQLRDDIKAAAPGKPFSFQQTLLIKTAFGTVDRLDRYVFALEKTIVDLSSKTQPVVAPAPIQQFTDTSFFGLIKLAFKQLFKRSK